MERPKIGELLVAAGVIEPAALEAALEKQRAQGGRIGTILLGMGALDEEMLVRSVARQLDMPVAWLRGKQVRADVLLMLPKHIALKHRCLPVMLDRKGAETLLVAMEDPSDAAALDEVAIAAGRPVRVVLSAPSELDDALARHYPETEQPAPAPDPEQEPDQEDEEPELLLTEPLGEAVEAEPDLRRVARSETPAAPPAAVDPLDLGGDYHPNERGDAPEDLAAGGDDLGLDIGPDSRAPGPGDSLDDAIGAVRGIESEDARPGSDPGEESESLFGDDPLDATLPPPPRRPVAAEALPRDPELRAIALLLIERGLLRSEELSERLLALRRDTDPSGS